MLPAILQVGSMIAICAGAAYFLFTYMPYIIEFFNSIQNLYFSQISQYVPPWLQSFILVGALFSGIGLLVKLL